MKLWIIGEKSSNPDDWDGLKKYSLIIAETAMRAMIIAGHGVNEFVTEVDLTKERAIWYRGVVNVPRENRVGL